MGETVARSQDPITNSYQWLKSAMDRYVALAALVVLGPLMAVVAVLIRWDSPGPAIFRQIRAGKDGRPFTLFKFRTMRAGVDPYSDSPRSGCDPRFTRLGRILREWSLDELPQLVNVCRGEMSLVGPRPLYMQQVPEWSPRHRGRLRVKPGLTGLAQVNGRGAATIEDKLEWDIQYVECVNLRTDLAIIWRTFRNVWSRSGIYEVRYSQHTDRLWSEVHRSKMGRDAGPSLADQKSSSQSV
jgi:lipopolysaccharide/colanic/teichoic acid biosynthesis glycosyltransferase